MRIVNNISAYNTHRQLSSTNSALGKTLEKLSSGLRINRAADDAAGLAISEKMRAQIGGMNQALRNAQDGISLIQTAEGALNETHSILRRMRDLAVQASNGTYNDDDRAKLDAEFDALKGEVSRIAEQTTFNTKELLTGGLSSGAGGINFQIGAMSGQTINVAVSGMTAGALGIESLDISSSSAIATAISTLSSAIDTVSENRAGLGAAQNRLEHTIANLGVTTENLMAAESRVRDVDMASEMSTFTKHQILMQSATAMLAQANMKPQSVLSLLG